RAVVAPRARWPKRASRVTPWSGMARAGGDASAALPLSERLIGSRSCWHPATGGAERLARGCGQLVDHEVPRVLHHVSHHPVVERPVERNRVPVALVEVVAGADRRIAEPQLLGERR